MLASYLFLFSHVSSYIVFLTQKPEQYFSNVSHIHSMPSNGFIFYKDLCNQVQVPVHYQDLWGLTQSVLGMLYPRQLLHFSGLSYCVPATMTDEFWTLHTYSYICAFVLDIPFSKCCPLIWIWLISSLKLHLCSHINLFKKASQILYK